MGTRGSFYLVQNEEGHFLGKRNFPILLQWRFIPLNMDSSSWDSETDFEEEDWTSDEEELPPKIVKDDLLRDALPANTILIKNGKVANLHCDLMEYFEDCWEDQEGIECNPCGVLCSCCNQIAYPNVEMIVLEDIRYFLILEETIPLVKCKDNEFEGFLQCVYCFNFYHRFGCTLSMSKQSYINNLLSRDWACPTCVPEFSPAKRHSLNVKSDCEWKLLVKIFKQLQNKLQPKQKPNECYCKYMTEEFLDNFISEEQFKYEFG